MTNEEAERVVDQAVSALYPAFAATAEYLGSPATVLAGLRVAVAGHIRLCETSDMLDSAEETWIKHARIAYRQQVARAKTREGLLSY
ncbi:MAG: hypothetical protein KIT41_14275 [Pyrinomonadaceae bacterium]|nr:hypothetical protein [Pyrinomonadaceae bacterium]